MAVVVVLREGKEIQRVTIVAGREFIAGRAETCDIVLADSAISRQHLKFYYDGKWHVQIISRFGQISHLGALHQALELENGLRFYSGDFEFRFEDEAVKEPPVLQYNEADPDVDVDVDLVMEEDAPAANSPSQVSAHQAPTKKTQPAVTPQSGTVTPAEDRTAIGVVNAVPFVRVYNAKNQKTVDIKLDGQKWKGGRAPECQIVLDEGASSRMHFEILKVGGGFQIRDLGSSNGTRLNGDLIDEMQLINLNSGDIIAIGGTTIEFQVRDPQFASRLQSAGIVPYSQPMGGDLIEGQRVEVIGGRRKKTFKMKPIHGLIGGIFAFILIVSLVDGPKTIDGGLDPLPGGQIDQGSNPPTNSNLTKTQQKYLEDTYNLAESLFKRQKYAPAIVELKKIHEIVPQFKRSRELETLAQQSIDIQAERDAIEDRRRKEDEMKQAALQIIDECRAKNFKTVAQAEQCLQPAVENDPENEEAKALVAKIQRDEEKREQNKANEAALKAEVSELNNQFNKAAEEEKAGHLLDAIASYGKVAKSSSSDPKGLKPKAKAKITQLDAQMKDEIKKAQQKASELAGQEKFKDALTELKRALEFEPSNTAAKAQFDKIYKELTKRLKSMYGDSVLEESLGNVEAAKQKWNTIMEMDLETGEYYQKAKRMLKRYGG